MTELELRLAALHEQVAELTWELGGLAYEMAIRDHFRLDVLVRRAAVLQEADAELGEVERLLAAERLACRASDARDTAGLHDHVCDLVELSGGVEHPRSANHQHRQPPVRDQLGPVNAAPRRSRVTLQTRRRALSSGSAFEAHLLAVHQLEDEADRLSRDAIASLFAAGIDPMVVIRWKDIFEALEAAVDACEHVAHVLEGIALERAR